MITFKYNEEDNIFHVTRQGEIGLDEIIQLIKEIDQHARGKSRLLILENSQEESTKITTKDLPVIVNELKKRVSKYKEVKCAVIYDNPYGTAVSILYEKLTAEVKNYCYKTFSTMEAGEDWLKHWSI